MCVSTTNHSYMDIRPSITRTVGQGFTVSQDRARKPDHALQTLQQWLRSSRARLTRGRLATLLTFSSRSSTCSRSSATSCRSSVTSALPSSWAAAALCCTIASSAGDDDTRRRPASAGAVATRCSAARGLVMFGPTGRVPLRGASSRAAVPIWVASAAYCRRSRHQRRFKRCRALQQHKQQSNACAPDTHQSLVSQCCMVHD